MYRISVWVWEMWNSLLHFHAFKSASFDGEVIGIDSRKSTRNCTRSRSWQILFVHVVLSAKLIWLSDRGWTFWTSGKHSPFPITQRQIPDRSVQWMLLTNPTCLRTTAVHRPLPAQRLSKSNKTTITRKALFIALDIGERISLEWDKTDATLLLSRSIAILGDGSDLTDNNIPSPPSNLHRSQVLNNEKLLDSIFSFFIAHPRRSFGATKWNDTDKQQNMNLLKASLACKNFFPPAMRVLWQSIESVTPLMKLVSTVVQLNGYYVCAHSGL